MYDSEGWGDWQDARQTLPKLGTYIQVHGRSPKTSKEITHEGVVIRIDEVSLTLSPISYETHILIRWRERKPKGLDMLERIARETIPALGALDAI